MGCKPRCNSIPPILDNPTANEEELWRYIASLSQGCIGEAECTPVPQLDNPTECEQQVVEWLRDMSNQCRKETDCNYILPLLFSCPPNLKALKFTVESGINSGPGDSGTGGGGGVTGCGETGLPLSISTFDANVLGPGTPGTIECNHICPEIRLTAAGGVSPYTWEIEGNSSSTPVVNCDFRRVGCFPGAPEADGVCNSRFVISAPPTVVNTATAYVVLCRDLNTCFGIRSLADTFWDCKGRLKGFGASQAPSCRHGISDFTYPSDFGKATTLCATFDCAVCANPPGCLPGIGCFCQIGDLLGGLACSGGGCSPSGVIKCPSPGSPPTALCNGCCCHITNNPGLGHVVDQRSALLPPDDENCQPCGLCFNGLVVTVTDAIGTQVSVTLTTNGSTTQP